VAMGEDRPTDSGIELKPVYTAADVDPTTELGLPGEPPFTRGIYSEMYRSRLWTMRQYAGMGALHRVRPAHPDGP
jgi:methylmalonyl-CoA mutase, N-terminal domain